MSSKRSRKAWKEERKCAALLPARHSQPIIARAFPSLPPEMQPRIATVDGNAMRCSRELVFDAAERILRLDTNFVSFDRNPGQLLREEDVSLLERLNATSWGYPDGTTAVVLAGGSGGETISDFFGTDGRRAFAVVRGGAPFATPTSLLFAFPGGGRNVNCTVACSTFARTIELSVTLDHELRRFCPTGSPRTFRDATFFSKAVDMRVFARYATPARAVLGRVLGCEVANGSCFVPNEDSDETADARIGAVTNSVPFSQAIGALLTAVPPPVQWYCVLVSSPSRLCTDDDAELQKTFAKQIPLILDQEQVFDPVTILREGYAVPPPPRDELSGTTEGLLRDFMQHGAIYPVDCDEWNATRKDNGLLKIAVELVRQVPVEERPPQFAKWAALQSGLRIMAYELRFSPTESEADLDDMIRAYKALISPMAMASPASRDLETFLFYAIARMAMRMILN